MDVDTAVQVPVSLAPLVDKTDFVTIEDAIAYDEAGMAVAWNFVTTAGVMTTTAVTPTTGDDHDWFEEGTNQGMYSIEIPASGGDANNDTEGFGWITGETDTCVPFRGPTIGFRAAALNDINILATTAIVVSTAKAGTLSTTQMSTNLTEATNDHWIGRTVIWTTGVLAGQASNITDSVGTNGVLTYSTVTEAPSADDAFVIV